jgi:hypothetical protein
MRILTIVAVMAALFLPADVVLARGDYIPVPGKYRFTGVVGTLASPASHAIFVGDGVSFSFSDKATPPVKAYRLCLYKKRSAAPSRCWRRPILRRNYDRDRFTVLSLPTGQAVSTEWTAKWSVGGRVVATWRFIYLQEGE